MSVVILARRGRLSLAAHQLFVMRTVPTPSGAKAPYAVAIASGVYLALLQQLFRSASV
jgi:Flp pilus assembly protein protease CpaA